MVEIRKRFNMGKKDSLILFLIPITIYMIVFFLYPVIYEVYISFFKYSLGGPKEFIGFGNYAKMLRDEEFINSLATTAVFMVAAVLSELVLGMMIEIGRASCRERV